MTLSYTESFPKILVLNRVDILLAVERFGNKSSRNKHHADTAAEEQDLSTLERKKKRAQKAGILVPVFGAALAGADAPILPQALKRVSRELDQPQPQKTENIVEPKAVKEEHRSSSVDIPNGSVHGEATMPEQHVHTATTPSYLSNGVVKSPHSSPQHRAISPLATTGGGNDIHQNRKQMKAPVNRVKLLPTDVLPLQPQGSKQPPSTAPKPSTSLPKQKPVEPSLLAHGVSIENPNFSNHHGSPPSSYYNTLPIPTKSSDSLGSSSSTSSVEGGASMRRPLAARKEGEISLDFGETSLGFSVIHERTGQLNRMNSNSVPDLLSDETLTEMRSPQHVTHASHLHPSMMSPRHRQLASSLGDLLDDSHTYAGIATASTNGVRSRTSTGSSSASGHSDSSKQFNFPPPPVSQ